MKALDLIVKACIIVQTNKLVLNIVNLKQVLTIDLKEDGDIEDLWSAWDLDGIRIDVHLSLDDITNEFSLCIYDVNENGTEMQNELKVTDFKIIGNINKILLELGYIVC